MRCNICGYEDDKQFSVCPYCGERVTQQNHNVVNNSINNPINSSVNSPINYNGDFGAIPTPTNINQPSNSAVTRNVLQTTQPKGFVRTMTGFKINHAVDDGEFYHRYIFFNILGILSIILFFVFAATSRDSDGSFFILFLCFFLFMSFSSLINHIYSTLMNNFTFEVSPEGIFVKSLMKQCFISRNNIKVSWFENISKVVDKFNYGSFFMSFFRRRYRRTGIFDDILFDRHERYDNSDMFHNEKEFKRANNVFIEVEEPIFKNDIFASEDKKCLRLINTGLSFQSASEARFVDQEFKRVLGLPDIPVPSEYDYNFKTGKSQKDTRTPFDRN